MINQAAYKETTGLEWVNADTPF